jgi:hypothetical protein
VAGNACWGLKMCVKVRKHVLAPKYGRKRVYFAINVLWASKTSAGRLGIDLCDENMFRGL